MSCQGGAFNDRLWAHGSKVSSCPSHADAQRRYVLRRYTRRHGARAFYEGILGLTFVADEHFALVFDLNGHMLRIAKTGELTPAKHTVLGWHVSDIAKKVSDLAARGVVFQRFEGMTQDALGIWTSPSGAKVAWFKDPDGNNLSLTQFPPSAL